MRAGTLIVVVALTMGSGTVSGQDRPGTDGTHVLRGFVDFSYLHTGRAVPDGFRHGRMVGELASRPGESWAVLGSVSATVERDGLQPALEQAMLRWMADERLVLSLGRQYAPVGYWNSAFRRGAWRRTTVDSPAMVDRDRALLPLYSLGLTASGEVPGLGSGLRYVTGIANGRDRVPGRPVGADAVGAERAWIAGLRTGPTVLNGLRVGGMYYRDRAPADEPASRSPVDERILSAFAAWQNYEPRVLAEYAQIRHSPADGDESFRTRAYYLQASYGLAFAAALRPYVRAERIAAAAGDPLLADGGRDYEAIVAGLRYDFTSFGAAKVEYRSERFAVREPVSSLYVQASVRLSSAPRQPLLAARPPSPPPGPRRGGGEAADTAPADSPAAEPAGADADARAADETPTTEEAGQPAAGSDDAGGVAIVAHPDLGVEDLSLPELRRIFRGDRQFWSGDERIVLLIPTTITRERPIVLERIYQMGQSEFRQFWLSKLFRTAGAFGPKMVSDLNAAQELVASLPGAITFMPAAQVASDVRVIRIDGRLPGDPGYPLR